MAFKETLVAAREQRGMTQQDLAEKLYVTRQAVSRWENGETEPSVDMRKLIATVLDVLRHRREPAVPMLRHPLHCPQHAPRHRDRRYGEHGLLQVVL